MTSLQRLRAHALKWAHGLVHSLLTGVERLRYSGNEVFLVEGEDFDDWVIEGRVTAVRVDPLGLTTYLTCQAIARSTAFELVRTDGGSRIPVHFLLAAKDLRPGPVPRSHLAAINRARVMYHTLGAPPGPLPREPIVSGLSD